MVKMFLLKRVKMFLRIRVSEFERKKRIGEVFTYIEM